MIIHSDWHIYSEASYDASLPLSEISQKAKEFGFRKVGITDHANFNDRRFPGNLQDSVSSVTAFQAIDPNMILGAELTPIEKPEFDYVQMHGVSTYDVVLNFNEVCLDAEFSDSEDTDLVQKWTTTRCARLTTEKKIRRASPLSTTVWFPARHALQNLPS